MTKNIILCCSFAALTLLSGCKKARDTDEINQNMIYTNYELSYDATEDLTTVKANFRHHTAVGRQLRLSSPSEVRFNNVPLQEITETLTNATYYKMEINGFVPQGIFSWTNANGKVYNNEIEIRTADLPDDLLEIPTHEDYTLYWLGDALSEDGRIRLRFNVTGGSNKIYTENDLAAESLIIPADFLQEFSPGYAELKLERRYRPALQEKTHVGGRITAEYFSTQIGVDLTE